MVVGSRLSKVDGVPVNSRDAVGDQVDNNTHSNTACIYLVMVNLLV